MDKNRKRSGKMKKIPAFGNWDSVNDLPITQYFESAREAGLTRFSSSSDGFSVAGHPSTGDSYAVDSCKHHQLISSSASYRTRGKWGEKRSHPHLKEPPQGIKQAIKVYDLPTAPTKLVQNDVVGSHQQPRVPSTRNRRPPKAVDEDLYKIPPELLHNTHSHRKKKKLGFISRCLGMPCTA